MITIDLAGCTALVTGAGGGLGSEIARRFLEAGAAVVAQSRADSLALNALRDEHEDVRVILGDLEDEGFVAGMFTAHEDVTVLINNAGSYPSRPLLDTTTGEFQRVMRANLGITFSCLQQAARVMRAGSGGCIVNIGSLSASRPSPEQAAYNSAKAAVVTLTRSAAHELAEHGVRVNAVSPGLIDRPGLGADWPEGVDSWMRHCPMGRLGTPGDVADACLFLASPLASWITGHELVVDGGISAGPAY